MAELTTQERLQPSLLDRLSDHARFKEQIWLAIDDLGLARAGTSRAQLLRVFDAHGIGAVAREPSRPQGEGGGADGELFETLAGPRALTRALESLVAGAGDGVRVTVADLVRVVARQSVPNLQESRQDRVLSTKQMRGYVLRDLGWLLNTGNLATVVDLSPFVRAQRSVLNYGIPDVSGAMASEADAAGIALAIQQAIEAFEPRLQGVRVAVVAKDEAQRPNALRFVIEASLWARPTPESLFLRTELDLESAELRVSEAEAS